MLEKLRYPRTVADLVDEQIEEYERQLLKEERVVEVAISNRDLTVKTLERLRQKKRTLGWVSPENTIRAVA